MIPCACTIYHNAIERGAFAIGSKLAKECPCECHEPARRANAWLAAISEPLTPCIHCGAAGDHDAGCSYAPALNAAELADLWTLAQRATKDRGDNAPMVNVTYHDGTRVEHVIPWLVALNMDPSLGY